MIWLSWDILGLLLLNVLVANEETSGIHKGPVQFSFFQTKKVLFLKKLLHSLLRARTQEMVKGKPEGIYKETLDLPFLFKLL